MLPHPLINFEIQKKYQSELNVLLFTQEIIYLK